MSSKWTCAQHIVHCCVKEQHVHFFVSLGFAILSPGMVVPQLPRAPSQWLFATSSFIGILMAAMIDHFFLFSPFQIMWVGT